MSTARSFVIPMRVLALTLASVTMIPSGLAETVEPPPVAEAVDAEPAPLTVDEVIEASFTDAMSTPPDARAVASFAAASDAAAAADVNASMAALSSQRGFLGGALLSGRTLAGGLRVHASPFGKDPVRAIAGLRKATAEYLIVWQRKSDNTCVEEVIGDDKGLFSNGVIVTPNSEGATTLFQNDVVLPQSVLGGVILRCPSGIVNLILSTFGDRFLDIVGGPSTDFIHGGAGNTIVVGGAGNDRLVSVTNDAILVGGAGDDALLALGRESSGDLLIGGQGADCFYDINLKAGLLWCGPGEDRVRTGTEAQMSLSCETTVPAC